MMNKKILDYIDEISEKVIECRRDFHKYPEVGWTEFRTASKIARTLADLGYDLKLGKEVIKDEDRMGLPSNEELDFHYDRAITQGADMDFIEPLKGGYTAVVGTLILGEGPVIACRFDIDALKVNEAKTETHFPHEHRFDSVNEGVMHSCGHDCHAAVGIGVAKALMNIKDQLNVGTVKLIFQPAEEGVRGAKSIVGAGVLDDVNYVIGGHLMATMPGGLVCGANGFLATTKYDVSFKGLSSHAGGAPEQGRNSMLAACTAVLNINAIPRHSDGASRVNVGRLESGSDRNVIAEESFMKMEIRGATNSVNGYLEDYAHRIIESSAKMHGVEFQIRNMGSAPSGSSSVNLIDKVYRIGNDLGCFNEVINTSDKAGGSEDFIYMMNKVQENGGEGVYFMVGSDTDSGHHTSLFDIKEEDMIKSVKMFTLLTLDILNN
jgi:aminobenzoyl-glutamate utilization protein A